MGVSNEAKNVIPLKFLRKIKNKKKSSCKLYPGTYGIQADSRSPFIRNFLISQNHINMKIGS
jgi:hypothetical protein